MDKIYDTNEKLQSFDFSKLTLSRPTLIANGSYSIRLKVDKLPLYIQPPPCYTKQGIIKNGRRYYTDLMFTAEDEFIIQWIEKLEQTCINYIYQHRNEWFDGDMELADVENYFVSPVKLYKSGKFYLIRTSIPTALEKPSIKIYDENENIVDFNNINDTTQLMTILEVQSIKCSARSFQIELELKQVLVIKPIELFNKCIIKTNFSTYDDEKSSTVKITDDNNTDSNNIHEDDNTEHIQDNIDEYNNESTIETKDSTEPSNNSKIVNNDEYDLGISTENHGTENHEIENNETENHEMENHEIENNETENHEIENDETENHEIENHEMENSETNKNEINVNTENTIEEVVFNLEELSPDSVILKQPNEVYYQMYRDARQKAKIAKEMALSSYLEAKQIKNTYMLNDIDDSDNSDLDNDSILSETN